MADQNAPNPEPAPQAPPAEAPQEHPRGATDRRKESLWSNAQFLLATLVTLCLFSFLAMLAWHPSPPDNRDLVNIIMTSITTGWVGVISYFFGSSSANRSKDTAIATLAAKSPTGGANA